MQGTYGTGRTLPAEISITNISEPTWDTDHDGIPDWWENQYGLDPNDPEDTFWISLGGGLTNGECFAQGLNPAAARAPIGGGGPPNAEKTDTDGDKVPDRQDKYPADKKRSRDLARLNYAEIDISTPLAEIGSKNVLMVALDDNNQVVIGYLESGNASAGVEDTLKVVLWKNGAKVGNTFSYPLTKEIGQDTWYLSPDYLNASGAIAGKAIKGG